MELIDAIKEIREKYSDARTSKGVQILSPDIDTVILGTYKSGIPNSRLTRIFIRIGGIIEWK